MHEQLEYYAISDAATINPSLTRTMNRSDEVSFIPMSDVSDTGRWVTHQTRKYDEVKAGYTAFENGDILFAKITPCMENGKGCHVTRLLNGIGFGSTEFHVLRPNPENDGRFLFHWLQTDMARRKAETFMMGSAGQQRVQRIFFDHFFIPKFSLTVQRRIAEILDSIDEAIQKTEALIDKLKAMKKGLLHDLLTRGLDENGKLRDPQTHPEEFKESSLGRIPKAWNVMTLMEICRSDGGSIQTGPFGSQLHAEDYKDSGVPIITVEHLGENRIIHHNLPLVGDADYKRLLRYVIRSGDLVFSRVGAIDRCAYVSEQEDGWLFSGRCLRVRASKSKVDARFLSYQLNSPEQRQWILNHSVGSTMSCLNTSILSNLPVRCPSLREQQEIAAVLFAGDMNIMNEERFLHKLSLQKKGLMHDLLTGRVRVKVDRTAENERL